MAVFSHIGPDMTLAVRRDALDGSDALVAPVRLEASRRYQNILKKLRKEPSGRTGS